MPLATIHITGTVDGEQRHAVLHEASRIVAQTTGKPEAVVMVTLAENTDILMGGEPGPAAFVDVRGIGGLDGEVNAQMTARFCTLLHEQIDIQPGRVYVTCTDVPAANWGWNGKTFG